MSDTVYRMYAALDGTLNESAAVAIIQDDGRLDAILMVIAANGADAISDQAAMEISFGTSSTFVTNDIRISICSLVVKQAFLTNGGGPVSMSQYVPVDLPIQSGERVHLHNLSDTGMSGDAIAYLYTSARGGARRQQRRTR